MCIFHIVYNGTDVYILLWLIDYDYMIFVIPNCVHFSDVNNYFIKPECTSFGISNCFNNSRNGIIKTIKYISKEDLKIICCNLTKM